MPNIEELTYCSEHPNTATNLKCSRCDTLICHKCMVQAPVGIRCKEHGKIKKLPTYDVSKGMLMKVTLLSLLLGILSGGILGLILSPILWGIPYANLILIAGYGYVQSEIISLSTNRKKGKSLVIVGIIGIATCYCIFIALTIITSIYFNIFDCLAMIIGIYLLITRLR